MQSQNPDSPSKYDAGLQIVSGITLSHQQSRPTQLYK